MEGQLPDCLLKEFEKSAIVKVTCIRGVGNNTFILNGDFHVDERHAAKLVHLMKKKLRGVKREIVSDRDEIEFLESQVQEDPKRAEELRKELPRKEDQHDEMSDFIEFFTKAVAKTEKVFSNRSLSVTSPREDQASAPVADALDSAKSSDDAEYLEEQEYEKKLLKFLVRNRELELKLYKRKIEAWKIEMGRMNDYSLPIPRMKLWTPASSYLHEQYGYSYTPKQVRTTAFALSKMPVEILMEFDITLEEATLIHGLFR